MIQIRLPSATKTKTKTKTRATETTTEMMIILEAQTHLGTLHPTTHHILTTRMQGRVSRIK